MLSGMTSTSLWPLTAATIARPMPVLPDVGSTIVPPGRSAPDFSAPSTLATAIRALVARRGGARGLAEGAARAQRAGLLGILDHRQCDAVLDRRAGVRALRLDPHFGGIA